MSHSTAYHPTMRPSIPDPPTIRTTLHCSQPGCGLEIAVSISPAGKRAQYHAQRSEHGLTAGQIVTACPGCKAPYPRMTWEAAQDSVASAWGP